MGPVNNTRDPLVCTEKSKVIAQPCVNSAQQCTWSPKVETHAKKEKKKGKHKTLDAGSSGSKHTLYQGQKGTTKK